MRPRFSVQSIRPTVIALLLGFPTALLSHYPKCVEELQNLAKNHYDNPDIYQYEYCFENSGELGRLAVQAGIPVEELNIVLIRHRDLDLRQDNHHLHHMILGTNKHTRGDSITIWSFHAVLSHRGAIIDLDRKEGWLPVPFKDYLNQMFPPARAYLFTEGRQRWWEKLGFGLKRNYNVKNAFRITEVPIQTYLERFPNGRLAKYEVDFLELLPKYTVEEYVERLSGEEPR